MGELDLRARVPEQGSEPAPDADVRAHAGVLRVPAVHGRAFLRGHHLERELVVVPQEGAPLAVRRDGGGVGEDGLDGPGPLVPQGVVDAGHHGEVEAHVALGIVLGAVVLHHVLGPLVGLGQHDRAGELLVHHGPQLAQEVMGLGEVLAVRALFLEQVGDGVEPEAVHPHPAPVAHDVEQGAVHVRVLEVQVRLVGEEPVPEVLAPHRVEGPVGHLRVHEDDPRVRVLGVVVGPRRSPRRGRSDRSGTPGTTGGRRRCGS